MNWKKAIYYAGYVVPGVGVYREFKKPKSKRSILGTIGFSVYAIPFIIKITYLGTGIVTKEWNPVNYIKNFIEKKEEKKSGDRLEKTVQYEEL
ncbi:MAG: hypothetical protein ABIE36_00830 [Candidatus Diapherotrites archaeon]